MVHDLWLLNVFFSRLIFVETIVKPLKIIALIISHHSFFFPEHDKHSKGAKHMKLEYFAVKYEVRKENL